nr:hypothetical protein BaRGS_007584 [Batillaria attramentaria]
MEASNFEVSANLTCKVQEILPSGTLSASAVFDDAEFVTNAELACYLPDAKVKTDRSIKVFAISATGDGQLYGNTVNLTVYDSTCQNCTESGCKILPDTCLINDLCYQDGDLNPKNGGQQLASGKPGEIKPGSVPAMAVADVVCNAADSELIVAATLIFILL